MTITLIDHNLGLQGGLEATYSMLSCEISDYISLGLVLYYDNPQLSLLCPLYNKPEGTISVDSFFMIPESESAEVSHSGCSAQKHFGHHAAAGSVHWNFSVVFVNAVQTQVHDH